jgi:mannose-1-phosphate guanylyltransferase
MNRPSGAAGMRIRAVVLAAGFGRRLEPLTQVVPKPLFPVAGRSLLSRTLARLAAIGCEAAAINLHHLGDQIRSAFGPSFRGMPLTYSEEPTILGTLGALVPLREFLAPSDVVLILNSDTLCHWPLRELLDRHCPPRPAARPAATLLLASRPAPKEFGGGVGIDREGMVVSLAGATSAGSSRPARQLVFGGAQALDPLLLDRLPAGVSDSIRDLHAPLIREGVRVATLVTGRRWHDMGTPRRFLAGVFDVASRGWVSPRARLAPHCLCHESVVEGGTSVGSGARVERSLVLPGAHIGEGAEVRDALIGFGAVVAANSRVDGELVARDGFRIPLGGDASA